MGGMDPEDPCRRQVGSLNWLARIWSSESKQISEGKKTLCRIVWVSTKLQFRKCGCLLFLN